MQINLPPRDIARFMRWLWVPTGKELRGLYWVARHVYECQRWTNLIFKGDIQDEFLALTDTAGRIAEALDQLPRKGELKSLRLEKGPLFGLLTTYPPYACLHISATYERHQPINQLFQTMILGAGYYIQTNKAPQHYIDILEELTRAYRHSTELVPGHLWDEFTVPESLEDIFQSLGRLIELTGYDDNLRDCVLGLKQLYTFCEDPYKKKRRNVLTHDGQRSFDIPGAYGRDACPVDGSWIMFDTPELTRDHLGTLESISGYPVDEDDMSNVALGLADQDATDSASHVIVTAENHRTHAYSHDQLRLISRQRNRRIQLQTFDTQLDMQTLSPQMVAHCLRTGFSGLTNTKAGEEQVHSLLLALVMLTGQPLNELLKLRVRNTTRNHQVNVLALDSGLLCLKTPRIDYRSRMPAEEKDNYIPVQKTIRLPIPHALLEAFTRMLPADKQSMKPFSRLTEASYRQYTSRLIDEHAPGWYNLADIDNFFYGWIRSNGEHRVCAEIICGRPHTTTPATHFYAGLTENRLQAIYQRNLQSLQDWLKNTADDLPSLANFSALPTKSAPSTCIGSRYRIRPDRIKQRLYDNLNRVQLDRHACAAPERQHNNQVWLLTELLNIITLHRCNNHIYKLSYTPGSRAIIIRDKDASKSYRPRYVPTSARSLKIINDVLHEVQSIRRAQHSLISLPDEQQGAPSLIYFISYDNGADGMQLTATQPRIRELFKLHGETIPVRENYIRHHVVSYIVDNDLLPQSLLELAMGHCRTGQHPLGRYSGLNMHTARRQMSTAMDQILSEILDGTYTT